MDKERKTGIDIIGDVSWGTHLCQFYKTKKDLIDILVPYFKAGLENNEFCMWVTSDPLKVEDVKTALKKVVKNLDNYIKKGQIEILDYTQWYTKSEKFEADKVLRGWVEKEKQAIKRGFDGLRLTGNTFWLEKKDWRNFTDYEATVHNTISKYRMIAICSYSLDKCGASEVIDIVNSHQFALIKREGKWEIIQSSERKKAEEQLKTRLAYEKTLAEISNRALTNSDLDSFINFSLRKLGELTNASRTYIFKIYDNGKKTSNTHEWCAKGITSQIKNLQNLDCDTVPFWMKKLHKNEIINFFDVKDFSSPEREIMEEQNIKSILVVPMYTQKGLYGFMGFDECKKHRKWETNDVALLRTASQIITQVIERKEAEEALKESELRLKKLFDLSPIGIVIVTVDGKIEYVNNVLCDMFGYKKEEVIGKMTKEFFVDPKERDKSIEIIKKEGQRLNYIFNYKRKDGKTGIALANSKLIDLGKGLRLVIKLNDITELKKLEKDKRILSKKVEKLTKKILLTKNEKLVFYGLVKYPLLNDHQLSEKLKIKRSTITAIKNKLLRQDFYSTYIIPNFELIGCELMCILNGKTIENIEEGKKIIKKIVSSPEVMYDIRTDKDFLSMIVSKNFVEAKRLIDYVLSLYEGSNIEMPNIFYFPFEMSRIINLFDYSILLKSLFNLEIEEGIIKPVSSTKRELANNEKIVLYALTKYPDLTDSEIAAKTKISRPTVNLIKKNLLKEDFLRMINIPDVKKLNLELLVYSNAKIDLKKIKKEKPEVSPLIFMVNSERESSGIFIFENYTKYKIAYDRLTSLLKEKQFIIGEPTRYLFPIQQIKSQKIDFAPLVKKVFGLKVDF